MSTDPVRWRLNRAFRRVVLDAVLRNDAIAMRHGLQIVDGQVLNLLTLDERTWTPSEVGAATGLPSSTITRVLDRLEQAGFVRRVRDAHDRRRVTLQPQPDKVRAMYADYTDINRSTDRLAACFSEADLDTVARSRRLGLRQGAPRQEEGHRQHDRHRQ